MGFKKGQSGNPAGKPKGAKDKRTALRELLEPHQGKLVRKAVSLALAGDTTALRLCLDRLMPPLRAKDAPILLPLGLTGTLVQRGEQVLGALSCGDLTPDEASSLMQTLTAQLRITEADDLQRRVMALERALLEKHHEKS